MFKILQLFLMLAMITFSSYADNINKSEFNEREAYLKALDLADKGEFKKAIELYEKLLAKESSSAIYDNYIYALVATNQIDKAVTVSREAEAKYPTVLIFPLFLAQYYQALDVDRSIEYYNKVIKLSDKPEYKVSKAILLESKKDYKGAISVYNELLKSNEDPIYYTSIGRIYQKEGKNDLAIKNFKVAFEKNNDLIAALRLADIYSTMGKVDEAKKYLEKVISYDDISAEMKELPEIKLGELYIYDKDYKKAVALYSSLANKTSGLKRASVLKILGNLQSELQDYDNATKTFETVVDLTPTDTVTAYLAGYIYEMTDKKDKAKAIYEKSLSAVPDYTALINKVAYLYLVDNETEKAFKHLSNVPEVEKDVTYYILLAEVYSQKKDNNKAVITLLDGLNSNPTSEQILYSLAAQYDILNEKDKAITTIKKAMEISPNNPIYQNFLGYTYANLGINIEEAFTLIKLALDKDPKNPAYLDSMGWVLYRKNDLQNGLKYIEEALQYAPDEKEILEHRDIIKEKIKSGKK